MRAGKLKGMLVVVLMIILTGCGLLTPGNDGDTPPPSTAALDEEGYGEVKLAAVISGDIIPSPAGVAVNSAGQVYISDDVRQRLFVFSATDLNTPVGEIGEEGSGLGQFVHPREIVIDQEDNLYVIDDGNSRIQKLSPTGEPLAVFGRRQEFSAYFSLEDGYDEPLSALGVDEEGNVYVGISGAHYDISAHAVMKFSPSGEKIWTIESTLEGQIDLWPFAWPGALVLDPNKTLYLAHGANGVGKIMVLPQRDGRPTEEGAYDFGRMGKGPSELMHTPAGIALTAAGDILIADTYNNRLQLFEPAGTAIAMYRLQGLDTVEFDRPGAISIAPGGSVFVVDEGNKRVLKLQLIPPAKPAGPVDCG